MAMATTASGRRIHYEAAGSGPPALFIAGLGSTGGSWADAVAGLSSDFRCIALDNRDAGANDPEAEQYSIADMADDCAAFLRAIGVPRAHVIGSSMGGFIAQHLALNYPAVVDHLVLVGTSPVTGLTPMSPPDPAEWIADPLERARRRIKQTVAAGSLDDRPARVEELARQTRHNRMTVEGYARQTRAINETHDVRARLRDIAAPTLIIHGDVDPLIPPRAAKLLAEGIPGARLEVLEGVGHIPHREVPEEFCRLTRAFLLDARA